MKSSISFVHPVNGFFCFSAADLISRASLPYLMRSSAWATRSFWAFLYATGVRTPLLIALFLALTFSMSLWRGESSSANEKPVAVSRTAVTAAARVVHLPRMLKYSLEVATGDVGGWAVG